MTEPTPEQLALDIFDGFAGSAPKGWRRLTLKVWASVVTYQLETQVIMADGSSVPVEPTVDTETISNLRSMMYHPERGTWFSARFELRAGSESEAAFNYDNDPEWWPSVPPEVFARDLATFPRSPEYMPKWLADLLNNAGDFDTGIVPENVVTPTDSSSLWER